MVLILLALAMAPGVAIAIFIYFKDKFDKEPLHLLILSFFLGILSTIPAIVLEQLALSYGLGASRDVVSVFIIAFGIIGISEEGSKYAFLRLFPYRSKAFNEPYDGITYAVMISMGFATLENIFYVLEGGVNVAFARMLTAVPAHATFGILMGYFVGLAKFSGHSWRLRMAGLLTAIVFHGAYDFCLLKSFFGSAVGALVSLFLGVYLSLKAIRLHAAASPFKPGQVAGKSGEEHCDA